MDFTKKEQAVLSSLNENLPGIKINSMRAGSEKAVAQAAFFTSAANGDWRDSAYFYEGPLSFVHFTSLHAVETIIRERMFKLYNLYNLNDPREFSYAGRLLTMTEEKYKDGMQNFFMLSMCKSEILSSSTEYEFNLWRLYGNGGKGAALEITFGEDTPFGWHDYFLSEVHYGAGRREPIVKLHKLLEKLESETPKIEVDIARVACFHKSQLFSLEKEIRLLFDNREIKGVGTRVYSKPEKNRLSPIIRPNIDKTIAKNKTIRYLELPLFYSKFEPVTQTAYIPVPNIKSIIVGYHYRSEEFKQVRDMLGAHCELYLGYCPAILSSRLTKYYHDFLKK